MKHKNETSAVKYAGRDPAYFYISASLPILPARLTSAAFGILTIAVLFKIGEKCFNREIGLNAAAIMGLSNIHLYY